MFLSYYDIIFELRKRNYLKNVNDIGFYSLDGFTFLNYVFGSAELKNHDKI